MQRQLVLAAAIAIAFGKQSTYYYLYYDIIEFFKNKTEAFNNKYIYFSFLFY